MIDAQLSAMMTSAVTDVVVDPNLADKVLAGDRRRQRIRRRIAAGVTAVVVIGAGVASAVALAGAKRDGPARLIPVGPPVVTAPTAPPSVTPTASRCPAQLPASWASRLQAGTVPLAPSLSVVPFAMSPDGSQLYAGVWGPDWSGVAAISRTGQVQRIHAFPTGGGQVFWGDASENNLIWAESYSPTDLSQGALFIWDRAGNTVGEIAKTPVLPVVGGSHATWVDSTDAGHSRVHLFDLASHTDHVVFTGSARTSTIAGDWLVWTGGTRPDQPATLHLVDVTTGAALSTPPPLDKVTGVSYVTGGPGTLTWIGSDGRTIYTWRTGMAAPKVLFYAGTGDFADYPIASGPYVVWTASATAYIADTTTGAVATLSTTPTQPVIRGKFVVLNTGSADSAKVEHPVRPVNVLDISGLPPLSGCTPSPPPR